MNLDLFAIDGVMLKATVIGLQDRLRPGELPRIEESLNAQEVFDSSSRIPRRLLRLEGENWDLELDTREVTIWGTGFLDCHAVEENMSFFLGQIRENVHCHFWGGEVTVRARWPLEPNPRRQKSVGRLLYEKSSRLKDTHLDLLPGGTIGAGISLLGITDDDDAALWHVQAGPVDDALLITLEMTFAQPQPSEWPDDELEQIESHIRRACAVMDNQVKAFIDAVMP